MFLIPAGMMLHGVDTEIEGRHARVSWGGKNEWLGTQPFLYATYCHIITQS